jgi:hypothetical protein
MDELRIVFSFQRKLQTPAWRPFVRYLMSHWSRWIRCSLVIALAAVSLKCGGDSSPTSPTPPPSSTPTRIIALSGNLAYGDVAVGASKDSTLTITNSGNAALNITGIQVTSTLGPHTSVDWRSGSIAPGASQNVGFRFSPTAAGTFNGTVTVSGDQTSGTNTIAFSGTGLPPPFSGIWTGTYIVERCEGTGSIQDIFCSANRGIYPVGTTLPITMILNQTGSTVAGSFSLGTVTGAATGSVAGGVLTLQGTATSSPISATITSFSTTVQGNSMSGNISYNVTSTGTPGVATVVTRLVRMTKP